MTCRMIKQKDHDMHIDVFAALRCTVDTLASVG